MLGVRLGLKSASYLGVNAAAATVPSILKANGKWVKSDNNKLYTC